MGTLGSQIFMWLHMRNHLCVWDRVILLPPNNSLYFPTLTHLASQFLHPPLLLSRSFSYTNILYNLLKGKLAPLAVDSPHAEMESHDFHISHMNRLGAVTTSGDLLPFPGTTLSLFDFISWKSLFGLYVQVLVQEPQIPRNSVGLSLWAPQQASIAFPADYLTVTPFK